MDIIEKTRKVYAERCPKCGRRIMGSNRKLFEINMKRHLNEAHNYTGIEEAKK